MSSRTLAVSATMSMLLCWQEVHNFTSGAYWLQHTILMPTRLSLVFGH